MNSGIWLAILAYLIWGILPVFWKLLSDIPVNEILPHRMVWSFIFVILILGFRKQWIWIGKIRKNPKLLFIYLLTGSLLSINWFTYIWSVNNNFVVDASLGYFINPLFTVMLGAAFLKEKMRKFQCFAIFIALIGVLYLTFRYGNFPYIALILSFTFGFYSLLKKKANLKALEGFSLEAGFMFIPAFFFILLSVFGKSACFTSGNIRSSLLLVSAGIATALPLILFAASAKRITLINLGILQYIAPTLQFLIGIFVFGESFPKVKLIGFSIIWIALIIYSIEGIIHHRNKHFGLHSGVHLGVH